MAAVNDDIFLNEAEDDLKTLEYVKNYLPADLKDKFDDATLQYFLDVIWEYYCDTFGDTDEEIEIDTEAVANHVAKIAKKEGQGIYDPEEILFVVLGELEYAESLEE